MALAILVAGCGGDDATTVPERPATTAADRPDTGEDPAATTPATTPPASVIAVLDDRIVELSSDDGAVLKTLLELAGASATTTWLEVDRAHGRIFFGQTQECGDQILMMPLAGGEPVVVAPGEHVSVSPDGSKLAFPRVEDGCAAGALVVRDLVTGTERTWRASRAEVISAEWAPDGRQLAYSIFDGTGGTIHVLDTKPPDEDLDAPVLRSGRLNDATLVGSHWVLAALERCDISVDPNCGPTLRTVDGFTGRVLHTFPGVPRLTGVDLDASGTLPLLHFTEKLEPPYEQTVLGRFEGSVPRRLAAAPAGDW